VRHRRIGIFGGTFDPIHIGHLLVASDAYEALSLDRVLFVPAANPPHKPRGPVADAMRRVAMVRAAIEGDARFAVDDLEVRRGGTSYTVDTLRELQTREPDAELVFLLGVDQFRALDSWREPREVSRLARLAVFARGGEAPDLSGPYEGIPVPVRRVDVSATEVRARAAAGRSIRYLVPEPVRRIIEAERLYMVGKGGA
jgi:nicotinate-nucleotide adenylyltransferase